MEVTRGKSKTAATPSRANPNGVARMARAFPWVVKPERFVHPTYAGSCWPTGNVPGSQIGLPTGYDTLLPPTHLEYFQGPGALCLEMGHVAQGTGCPTSIAGGYRPKRPGVVVDLPSCLHAAHHRRRPIQEDCIKTLENEEIARVNP